MGLTHPTLKLTEDQVQGSSDKDLRQQQHVLIAYSQSELDIINQYLEDIKEGKYGKDEKDAAALLGNYPVVKKFGQKRPSSDEVNCPCKCETWNEFKEKEGYAVKIDIFRDVNFNCIAF